MDSEIPEDVLAAMRAYRLQQAAAQRSKRFRRRLGIGERAYPDTCVCEHESADHWKDFTRSATGLWCAYCQCAEFRSAFHPDLPLSKRPGQFDGLLKAIGTIAIIVFALWLMNRCAGSEEYPASCNPPCAPDSHFWAGLPPT